MVKTSLPDIQASSPAELDVCDAMLEQSVWKEQQEFQIDLFRHDIPKKEIKKALSSSDRNDMQSDKPE